MEYDPPGAAPPGPARRALLRWRLPRRHLPLDRARRRRLARWLLPLAGALVLGVAGGIGVAAAIHMPRVESLADFTPGLITQLHDRNGQVFATYARERRVMLREGEMPALLQNAVIAAEDANFFRHGGIDAGGVARAVVANLRSGRHSEGASTITMQLARKLFLNPEKTWRRKIEESLLAVELEKQLSKPQILTLYCNLVFVGHGYYGMESAARGYFNKSVGQLTVPEAATLAGIIQLPSRYSPYRNPEGVVRRRNYVLRRMLEERFIQRVEHDAAVAQPLLLAQETRRADIAPYFAEEVRRYLEATYGATALYEQGLAVRTTLDVGMQRATEEAVREGLLRLDHRKGWRGPLLRLDAAQLEEQELPSWTDWTAAPGAWVEGLVLGSDGAGARVKIADRTYELTAKGIAWTGRRRVADVLRRGDVAWFRLAEPEAKDGAGEPYLVLEQEPQLQAAALVVESASGAVRAMVGGWAFERSKFNRATQARRQVGSGFKPFVYGAALEAGFTPADTLFDAPAVFIGADNRLSYSPRNYYRKYYGIVTLRRALELSINVTAVKVLDLIGAQRVVDFARRCGIGEPLPPYPSLALGSADVTPLQLAAAYATLANQGVYVEPHFVQQVSTPAGRALEQHLPRARKAMEPAVAYVLTHMLEGVIDRGTGVAARDLDLDIAGKTGTTDDYSDAWFIGFTPRYTILNWVGYDQKRTIGRNMTGAEAALPTWRAIVAAGLEDGWLAKGERFTVPPGVVLQAVEQRTGLLPGPGAERIIEEAFVAGTQPAKLYDPSWAGIMSLPWPQQAPFYIPREGERMPHHITDWALVRENWEAR